MDEYKGKIDINIAKKIISDHYDVYLEKENPCSRTICSHYDLDAREYMSDPSRPKPFAPHGAVDGLITDSTLAKKMMVEARWGNSCGIPFKAADFCKKHRQYENFAPYLYDRLTEEWTEFSIDNSYNKGKNKFRLTKRKKNPKSNKTEKNTE